ncbi:hypothetical protein [Geothrix sp. 21YS21S-2]|uniref:hypothetical protein n=1 Tax=Geothrix sp. 21YS21S-2 TaxID=3068893 RepID=UPI0027BA97B5|nr:hypothetical protein [Geothrix sp. 21YS21S-2]
MRPAPLGLQGGLLVRLTRRLQFRAGVEAASTILDSATTRWQAGITYAFQVPLGHTSPTNPMR